LASDADRVAMLRLAIAGRSEFDVSTIEVDRGGVSYTVETLRAFRADEPTADLFFLMGADSLADLPNWREANEICTLATPLVVRRAGLAEPDFSVLASVASAERIDEIRRGMVDVPGSPISSSEIRQLVAAGDAWRELAPESVADYIVEHGLYRV
jgi:nicotinate-nucleotide adenylyltransferase